MRIFQAYKILLAGIVCILSSLVSAQKILVAGQLAPVDQNYDFSVSKRCRLLAHQSIILKNDLHHIIVIDSGFGTFQTRINGSAVRVLDLNPFTVAFDLSADFTTIGREPLWWYKKPNGTSGPPVTNHGCLWAAPDQNTVYYHNGHYYNHSDWNTSLYHVNKSDIPPWQMWSMNVNNYLQGWKDVTNNTVGHELVNRTFAGVGASIPNAGISVSLGGVIDSTTSATTPIDVIQTTDQMLILNHTTNSITRTKYYNPQSTDGVYQGDLVHLPIGSKNGYLVSLMSLKQSVGKPWHDDDGPNGNQELGVNVTLDSIPMYDIETGTWFEQRTSWFEDQIPEPRTRFCAVAFHDEVDNTWSIWLHGGQQIADQDAGVREIYVLSMPSFLWTKVETTLPDTNLIRSHTCHAVGGNFIIVGGYPPGLNVPTNASCDPEYIKVANIGLDGVSWTGKYLANSHYRTPQEIRNVVNQRTVPVHGFANQKLADDFRWQPPQGTSNVGVIAGAVVGGVLLVFMILAGVWFWRKRRNRIAAAAAVADDEQRLPPSPPSGGLEVLPGGQPPRRQRNHPRTQVATTAMSETNQDRLSRSHELESPVMEKQMTRETVSAVHDL